MNQFGERRDRENHTRNRCFDRRAPRRMLSRLSSTYFSTLSASRFKCSISSSNASLLVCNGGAFLARFTGRFFAGFTIFYSTLETANHVGRPRLAYTTLCSLRIILSLP